MLIFGYWFHEGKDFEFPSITLTFAWTVGNPAPGHYPPSGRLDLSLLNKVYSFKNWMLIKQLTKGYFRQKMSLFYVDMK